MHEWRHIAGIAALVVVVLSGCNRTSSDRPGQPGRTDQGEMSEEIWEDLVAAATDYALRYEQFETSRWDSPEERTLALALLEEQTSDSLRRVANRVGRVGIEPLLVRCEDALKEDDASAYLLGMVAWVIVEIADPTDEQGLKAVFSVYPQPFRLADFRGIAAAAIASYQDQASCELLLRLEAFTFLRGYPASMVQAKIEAVIAADDDALVEQEGAMIDRRRRRELLATLASLAYADSLADEAHREQYRNFERRLWGAHAMMAFRGNIMKDSEYKAVAGMFLAGWQEGDDTFVLRIYAEPLTTLAERKIASRLVARFSDDEKKRLKAIADGTSPLAGAARRALQDAAHRSGSP